MANGVLFVISAPSGAGKSTLIEHALPMFPGLRYSVSSTTRAPREGEQDGIDYHFLSKEEFSRIVEEGGFLEWKEVHGNFYGTPAEPVKQAMEAGRDMILDIDVEGAKEVFSRVDNSVGVFVEPPDMEELERRLCARGTESSESLCMRLTNAESEMKLGDLFTYRIVNDDMDAAVKELVSIIEKESWNY